jgi:hypothetical protein
MFRILALTSGGTTHIPLLAEAARQYGTQVEQFLFDPNDAFFLCNHDFLLLCR